MDITTQRILATGLIGITLTLARRWKNEDPKSGLAVAGWTMFFIFILIDMAG